MSDVYFLHTIFLRLVVIMKIEPVCCKGGSELVLL